jgi:hypothetical protein
VCVYDDLSAQRLGQDKYVADLQACGRRATVGCTVLYYILQYSTLQYYYGGTCAFLGYPFWEKCILKGGSAYIVHGLYGML